MAASEQFPEQFSVLVRRDAAHLRVWLSGDLDIANRELVDSTLKAIVATAVDLPTEIRFDMSHVTFVDSSGVTLLLAARKLVRDAGGEVIVVRPPPMLDRLLAITALTECFVIDQ